MGLVNNSTGTKSTRKGKMEIRLDRYNRAKSYKTQEFRLNCVENG